MSYDRVSGKISVGDVYVKNDGDVINGTLGIQSDTDKFGYLHIGNKNSEYPQTFIQSEAGIGLPALRLVKVIGRW